MSNQITPNPSVPTQVVAEVKFPRWINNLGIIPTSYKDSMSYYECLAWLCKFLEETVIPSVNENGEAVEELQNLYIELNSYVTHYFETLDVQEEINNKLDAMVEDGTLPEIVADYLQTKAVFGFDTIAGMKAGTNLINGSFARTLGYSSLNDGAGGLYKIRTITNEDVIDEKNIIAITASENLIAELIKENEAICFDTVSAMISSNKLVNGMFAKTLGYYNINDGGSAMYKIRTKTVSDSPDNATIIQLSDTDLVAELIYISKINIKQFGAKGDGVTDDSAVFQTALDLNIAIEVPNGHYKITSSLNLNQYSKIYGSDMNETIFEFSDNTDYLFKYITEVHQSAYDIKTDIVLNSFSATCKNFIKINDDELAESSWTKQASLLHIKLSNLNLSGIYATATDQYKNTNTVPTFSELEDFGIGLNLNSLFNSTIEHCRITNFGIGIYLKGCDLNNILYNRFNSNGVHVYLQRISTYGSQNLFTHNEFLKNLRYGGIVVNETRFDTLEDNYFETYTASACFIKSNNEFGLNIIGNRFDNPQINNINILELAPAVNDTIKDNRINPNSNYDIYCEILPTNLSNGNIRKSYNLATFENNEGILLAKAPFTKTAFSSDLTASPNFVNYENTRLGGSIYASPFIEYNSSNGLYYFRNTSNTSDILKIEFRSLKKRYKKYLTVRIWYMSTAAQQYVNVTADGTSLVGAQKQISSDGNLHFLDLDFTSTSTIYNNVLIQLPSTTNVNIYGAELI